MFFFSVFLVFLPHPRFCSQVVEIRKSILQYPAENEQRENQFEEVIYLDDAIRVQLQEIRKCDRKQRTRKIIIFNVAVDVEDTDTSLGILR